MGTDEQDGKITEVFRETKFVHGSISSVGYGWGLRDYELDDDLERGPFFPPIPLFESISCLASELLGGCIYPFSNYREERVYFGEGSLPHSDQERISVYPIYLRQALTSSEIEQLAKEMSKLLQDSR
tara:strand:- start:1101 stop:1481 length:381 start_codon:yes stop_codon:yes gene_type:complete